MKNTIVYTFLCLLLVAMFACREDDINTDIDIDLPPPIETKYQNIQGFVYDENDLLLEGATVSLDITEVMTNELGYFQLNDLVNKNHATVKVSKPGYFDTYPGFTAPSEGEVNLVVKMTPKGTSQFITSSIGGRVILSTHGAIEFQPNSFKDESGAVYNGQVTVYTAYIDPSLADIGQVVSGDLYANDIEGNAVGLESYGMAYVELYGDSDQPLSISENAIMRIPVPTSFQQSAPSTIPLWYFDETLGIWIEEGSAQLDGDVYEGEVSHFTLWNCDVPYDLVEINGKIESIPQLDAITVCITRVSDGYKKCTTANSKGLYEGKVPKGELLLLEVLTPCGSVAHSENVGPLGANTDLGVITINISDESVTIMGKVLDCDMDPLADAVVVVNNGIVSHAIATDDQGNFQANVLVCDADSIEIAAIDWDNNKTSQWHKFKVEDTIDAGTISACEDDILESLTFFLDGTNPYIIGNCIVSVYDSTSASDSLYYYQFTSVDDDGNGEKVQYDIRIVNWTGDPNTPIWGISFEFTIFGNGTRDYFLANGDIQLIHEDTNPGGFIQFDVTNSSITNVFTGQTYTGSMRIIGVIQ